MAAINGDWLEALKDEFKKDQEYYNDSIFNALKCTVN